MLIQPYILYDIWCEKKAIKELNSSKAACLCSLVLSQCCHHCRPCSLFLHLRGFATSSEIHVHLLQMAQRIERCSGKRRQ